MGMLIVCLANSAKSSGRCIAGKTCQTGKWVRPISNRDGKEVVEREYRYSDGTLPRVRDIINIPVKTRQATLHQRENVLIDENKTWSKQGRDLGNLDRFLDAPDTLWGTGFSSYYGKNDRIPAHDCTMYTQSLYLIKVQSLELCVQQEGAEFDNPNKKIRAEFIFNNEQYRLRVTDPEIGKRYFYGADGTIPLPADRTYLCVSMGLPFDGFCYKMAASIIIQ